MSRQTADLLLNGEFHLTDSLARLAHASTISTRSRTVQKLLVISAIVTT